MCSLGGRYCQVTLCLTTSPGAPLSSKIIIIIPRSMFMVLSSWHSHYESSPGSFDECRTAPGDRRPLDQANRLEPKIHLWQL